MPPYTVTPAQIARAMSCTAKNVRRMVGRSNGSEADVRGTWFGCKLRATRCGRDIQIEFASLPQHVREAFVEQDQTELPL